MRLNTLVRNSIAHRCAIASISSTRGRPRILSDAETLDAVFFVCRTGCQWSALRETHWCSRCAWKTIYHRFRVWARLRIFDHVFHDLATNQHPRRLKLPFYLVQRRSTAWRASIQEGGT